jgi:tetratricopeptide (TPR) repeat protein
MEHNRGNFEAAISYFRQSLEKNREAEYIYYSLAASLAQKGEAAEAIQVLRRAIELNDDNQIYAKNDQDFASLHPSKEFADLVGMTPTGGAGLSSQS